MLSWRIECLLLVPLFVCSPVQEICAARCCGEVLQMSSDARGGARDVAIVRTASSRRSWCHAEKHNRSHRPNWEPKKSDGQVEGTRLIWKLIHQGILSPAWRLNNSLGLWCRDTFPPMSANFLNNFFFSSKLLVRNIQLTRTPNFLFGVLVEQFCFIWRSRTVAHGKIDVVPAIISLHSAGVRNKDFSVNKKKHWMLFPLQDLSLFTYQLTKRKLQTSKSEENPLIILIYGLGYFVES